VGLTYVKVRIAHPSHLERGEEVELLVDTGAMLTVVPRAVLQRLGVNPGARRPFRAFGGVVHRETGVAAVIYNGEVAGIRVIFGEEGDPAVLGVTALEALGYQVDPVTGELRPTEMLLL